MSMTGALAARSSPTTPAPLCRQRLSRRGLRIGSDRAGRRADGRRHPFLGARRRRGGGGEVSRPQRRDPPDPGQGREDLRRVEAQLRLAPNAMARPRQGRPPGSPHRHRLQPQARPQPHAHGVTDRRPRVPSPSARANETRPHLVNGQSHQLKLLPKKTKIPSAHRSLHPILWRDPVKAGSIAISTP